MLLIIIPEFSGLKQGTFIFVVSLVVMREALLLSPQSSVKHCDWLGSLWYKVLLVDDQLMAVPHAIFPFLASLASLVLRLT